MTKANYNTIEDELLSAAKMGNEKAIASALSSGAKVYTEHGLPIFAAAKNGHAKAVKILMCSLKEPTAFGIGAALTAITYGHPATLKTILGCMRCSDASLSYLYRHASHLGQNESAKIIRNHAGVS